MHGGMEEAFELLSREEYIAVIRTSACVSSCCTLPSP